MDCRDTWINVGHSPPPRPPPNTQVYPTDSPRLGSDEMVAVQPPPPHDAPGRLTVSEGPCSGLSSGLTLTDGRPRESTDIPKPHCPVAGLYPQLNPILKPHSVGILTLVSVSP